MKSQETDDLRRQLKHLFEAGVAAADPFECVARHIDGISETPALIVGVGKAAVPMTKAALERFPGIPALVVTNYENETPLEGARVLGASHPVPDENGHRAARAVIEALQGAKGPVLALVSGGGSALLPAPVEGVSLADKSAVNAALLGAGLDIHAMNVVRQQLSQLKGGGFLAIAAPNPVTALILSDVIGDDLSTIASGLTAKPSGTAEQAEAILKEAGIWDALPDSARAHLASRSGPVAEPGAEPGGEPGAAKNILVGSNSVSVAAMQAQSGARAIAEPVEGDVADAARRICDQCEVGITVWGGETTVRLTGDGKGGRNQELALRIALEAKARGWRDWACLQAGSDGRDGPTDAAGGLVDGGTLERIAAAGGDIDRLLANNDSYKALTLAGDLFISGATATNVADLGAMIRLPDA